MEGPETSIRSGPASARARIKRASDSGFVIDIAGLPLRMRAADAAADMALDAVFGSLPHSETPARAELRVTNAPIDVPGRDPDADNGYLQIWYEGDVLFLASEPFALRARVTPEAADIAGASVDEPALRMLLQPVITHLLAHVDVFVVHGAGVQRDGHGVLVLGATGQGKSTVALAALEHGWGVLSDDLVALELRDRVFIRGVPKPMALPGDLATSVLEDAGTMAWDGRGRRHVPAGRLDPGVAQLEAVVLVEHGPGAGGTIEPLAAEVVVSELMSAYASIGDVPLMRRFFPVAAGAARAPGHALRLGTDAGVRLDDTARVLESLIPSG